MNMNSAQWIFSWRIFQTVLLPLVVLSTLFVSCNIKKEDIINIGLAINLSGYSGMPAEDIRDGALLAIKEINRNNSFPRLKLLVKDDRNTARGVISADKELIRAGCPVIIGHSYSQNTLTAYPVVTGAGRILITAYTATTRLSGKDDLFFRTSVDNHLNSKALIELLRTEGIKDVLMVLDLSNPSFSVDLGKRVKMGFGGHVAQVGINTKEDVHWDIVIKKILEADPQAVILITEVKSTAILCQKLRGKGYRGTFLATIWAQGPYLLSYGADAVEGLKIVSFIKPRYGNEYYKHFEKAMMKQFHKKATPKSARAYELVFILNDAIKRCGLKANDPYCIKRELLKGEYNFLLGRVQFDRFGDVKRPVYCIKVKNGQFHFDHRIL